MRVVGVKQLKARLSEYLRDVRRGEVFLVTDRDQVIAELRPPASDTPPPLDDAGQVLEVLVEAREVVRAPVAKAGWKWQPGGIGLPEGAAARVLEELREERGRA